MKQCARLVFVVLLIVSGALAQTSPLRSVLDMEEFVHDWTISKQFTLDVANAMPAELYSFKPNPEEMTFGEQIVHIAGANVFRFHEISRSCTLRERMYSGFMRSQG